MARFPALICTSVVLILTAAIVAGCGGSTMNNGRMLQSLTVTPASADAQNFPGGKVQFTATGTFNMAPTTVMSPPVIWSIQNPSGMPTMPQATIDPNGLAQCNAFVGTTLAAATAPTEPEIPLIGMPPSTPTVSGTATLICP